MAVIKAIILGDSETGKTSFTTRWTKGSFPNPESLKTTIGASFDTKRVTLDSGNEVILSLWDFGGQKRFIEALKTMIKGAKIGLFFVDVSHLQSLDNLYNYWVPIVEEHGGFDFTKDDGKHFLLVGNKMDLISESFDRIEMEMRAFSSRFGIESALISAKTGVGIDQLDMKFRELCEAVL
ncbi:MAG: Rab family GTPase [Candidatus Thorarchaeota archaeon]